MIHKFRILNSRKESNNKRASNSCYHSDNDTTKQVIEQPKSKSESTSKNDSISSNKVNNDTIEHDICSYKYQFRHPRYI